MIGLIQEWAELELDVLDARYFFPKQVPVH